MDRIQKLMLEFEPFSLTGLRKALPYIKNNPSLCSDLSAGYLYMWHEGADVRFCVWNDTFVVCQTIGEQRAFSYPIGADPGGMIGELIEYAYDNHLPLRFFAVNEETLEKIRSDKRLSPVMWAYDRKWSDYIYSFEEAMGFRGKKYSGQRNHINKFKKLYGEPDIKFLTPEDKADVKKLLAEYEAEHPDGSALERLELKRSKELFDVCEALELYAAGLFVEGRLAAFSIGEIIKDTLIIHVEKALTRYEGVYPTMYSGFVRLISERLGCTLTYINREDDSGDPGLRTSKTQYHPICLAHKHLVHVGTPAVKMPTVFSLAEDGVILTEIRQNDKQAYLKLNTDVENNRYWGYDYREDVSITGSVDENTFYDSVMYDMAAGDSINFAVRLAEDDEMIGEAILWNFTSDGTAELGCRILPEYQGKGYGKAAFGAVADFAVNTLNVKVWARCYRENTPSYRMIASNGFTPLWENEDFCYFEKRVGENAELALYAAMPCCR